MRCLAFLLLHGCLIGVGFMPRVAHARLELTPRAGVYLAVESAEEVRVPFTLGVAVQPAGRDMATFFVAPQLDILPGGASVALAPTVRAGLLLRDNDGDWTSNWLSYARIYAIAGLRMPGDRVSGVRVGVGFDSGVALLATLVGLRYGVPIPNAIEVIWEGVDGEEGLVTARFGVAF